MAGKNGTQPQRKKLDHTMLGRAAYELNLTTYEIGRQAGIPQPTISAILLGKSVPAADKLKAICDVLDLDMNEVFIDAEVAAA